TCTRTFSWTASGLAPMFFKTSTKRPSWLLNASKISVASIVLRPCVLARSMARLNRSVVSGPMRNPLPTCCCRLLVSLFSIAILTTTGSSDNSRIAELNISGSSIVRACRICSTETKFWSRRRDSFSACSRMRCPLSPNLSLYEPKSTISFYDRHTPKRSFDVTVHSTFKQLASGPSCGTWMILSISAVAFQCNNFPPGDFLQICCRKETQGQNDLPQLCRGICALVDFQNQNRCWTRSV